LTLTLDFDRPDLADLPAHNGTETSKAAAVSMRGRAQDIQQDTILAFLRRQGAHGGTRQEIHLETGIDGNSVNPRVAELLKDGRAVETQRQRPTQSGRGAQVVVAREFFAASSLLGNGG
jgi:hypothetical protein